MFVQLELAAEVCSALVTASRIPFRHLVDPASSQQKGFATLIPCSQRGCTFLLATQRAPSKRSYPKRWRPSRRSLKARTNCGLASKPSRDLSLRDVEFLSDVLRTSGILCQVADTSCASPFSSEVGAFSVVSIGISRIQPCRTRRAAWSGIGHAALESGQLIETAPRLAFGRAMPSPGNHGHTSHPPGGGSALSSALIFPSRAFATKTSALPAGPR